MEIAFLTTVLPERRTSGGEIGSHAFIDALRGAGHRVTVFGFRRAGDPPAQDPDAIEADQRPIETDDAPRVYPAMWTLTALARGIPYSAAKYRSRAYRRRVREVLADGGFDLAVIDHAQMAWLLPDVRQAGVPAVTYSHNVEHRLYAGRAESASGPRRWLLSREAERMHRLERELAASVAAVWTPSEDDTGWFASLNGTPAITFSLPSPLAAAGRTPKLRDVALIGTWSWDLTRHALEWFTEEVAPLLPDHLTIEVAGRGADWLTERAPRVRYAGFVPDAQEFMAGARVVAVPAVGATGVQVKTLDAVASGSRVVASPASVRGLGALPRSVRVTATAEEFAQAVTEAAADPASGEPDREALEWTLARRAGFEAHVARAATAAVA